MPNRIWIALAWHILFLRGTIKYLKERILEKGRLHLSRNNKNAGFDTHTQIPYCGRENVQRSSPEYLQTWSNKTE